MIFPEDYINRPVRSLQTMLRVLSAVFPDLPLVNPDGVYGKSTEKAVRAFQERENLPATGVADNDTWNRLAGCYLRHGPSVLPPEPLSISWDPGQVILPGEENLHLFLIQAMMAALSRLYADAEPPEITGRYDRATKKAVLSLQALFGLEPNGVIDQRFWAHLARLYHLSAGNGAVQSSRETFLENRYLL